MIQLTGINHFFGSRQILRDLTFRLLPGSRTGLVGANGSGKTTLLRILDREIEPTEGHLRISSGFRIGYVPQIADPVARETPQSAPAGGSVGDYLLGAVHGLRDVVRTIEADLADSGSADYDRLMARYRKAREEYDALSGDLAETRAEQALDRLGLPFGLDHPAAALSGGERNTLAIVRALVDEPDFLILDEPGNHLDLRGIDRLEEFLASCGLGFLLVSHNRHLLDRTCNEMLELAGGSISSYSGNYSQYRLAKLQSLVAQQADYQANQKRLTRMRELVTLFEQRARETNDGGWGKRLRAQRSRLRHEEAHAVDKPILEDRRFDLRFDRADSKADIAVRLNGYSKRFGERELIRDGVTEIRCGERVVLVGPNGCGKSTLLDEIVKSGGWDNPVVQVGPSMRIGYASQHQALIDPERSVIDHLRDRFGMSRDAAFLTLSRFLFSMSDMDRPAAGLSGGERSRLQLSIVMQEKPNLLILDEPTNHLDVFAQESVEEALDDFDGTILFVSHDRYFIEKIARRGIEIADGTIVEHTSDTRDFLTEYVAGAQGRPNAQMRQSAQMRQDAKAPGGPKATSGAGSPGRKSNALSAVSGKRRAAEGTRPDGDAERKIMLLEEMQRELEKRIAAAFERGDHDQGRKLSTELARLLREINRAYDEWGG